MSKHVVKLAVAVAALATNVAYADQQKCEAASRVASAAWDIVDGIAAQLEALGSAVDSANVDLAKCESEAADPRWDCMDQRNAVASAFDAYSQQTPGLSSQLSDAIRQASDFQSFADAAC